MSSTHVIFFFYFMAFIIIVCNLTLHSGSSNNANSTQKNITLPLEPEQAYLNRKLFYHGGYCTNRDISISQSKGTTRGIPQYIVQIVNTCVSGCALSNIHLHCGWFASARLVSPRTFKRLSYDDCLVNGGKPLKTSQIISFTYYNSFMYPIAFKHAKSICP